MTCSRCGSEVPAGNAFCPQCGLRIEAGPAGTGWQASGPPPPAAVGVQLAGFWPRFGALLVDAILVAVAEWIVIFILAALAGIGGGNGSAVFVPLYVLVSLGSIAYYVWGYGTGQTIGCKALNLRIVDRNTGGPPGYGKGLGRIFAAILSGIPIYLGYFWMIWDPQKQTWHDKLSGTLVVSNSAPATYAQFAQG